MPLWAWIVFYALVLIMLVADLKMFGRKGEHEVNVNEAQCSSLRASSSASGAIVSASPPCSCSCSQGCSSAVTD